MPNIFLSKYELWNALNQLPDKDSEGNVVKTEALAELEQLLRETMVKAGLVILDIRTET